MEVDDDLNLEKAFTKLIKEIGSSEDVDEEDDGLSEVDLETIESDRERLFDDLYEAAFNLYSFINEIIEDLANLQKQKDTLTQG